MEWQECCVGHLASLISRSGFLIKGQGLNHGEGASTSRTGNINGNKIEDMIEDAGLPIYRIGPMNGGM